MKNNNNILIAKQIEQLKKKVRELLPELYSAFCSVLYNKYGWTAEQIAELFADTQDEWNKLVQEDSVSNMIEWCEKLTGVTLRGGE